MTNYRNSIKEYARIAWAMALVALAFGAQAATTNVTLAWDANTEANVVGYRLYYGTASGTYAGSKSVAANITSATISNLTSGQTYYFAAKATNSAGLESSFSTEVVYTAPTAPVPTNTAPVAIAQSVPVLEDTATVITLAGSDVDANPLSYAIVTSPAHGTLSGTVPNLTYTPAANYNGNDSFTFRVNDGTVNSAAATVSIAVSPINDPPLAIAQSVSTAEDAAKAITLTGTDPEGDSLTFAIVTSPAHGTLSGTPPNVTYIPTANYSGSDSFTFKAMDASRSSAAATVSITVSAINDAPIATAQSVSTAEDTAKVITLAGTDTDGNTLTYAIVTSPAHGTLSGSAPNVTYTPATNYNGSDSFTFRANDGISNSAPATVSITVTPVNDIPLATAQSLTTDKNTAKAITLSGSDVDGDSLTFSLVTQPTKGTLGGTAPNLTYTPNNNVTGADSFTFKANDGTADSTAATISITIAPGANTAPVALAQDVTTSEDVAKAITLSATDADGDTLTYSITTAPSHGTLSGSAPNLTYRPATNYNGSDSFWFRASDGVSNSAQVVVSITVNAVNDAPIATSQSISTAEDTAKAITLAGTDVDGDSLTYSVVTGPAHGTLSGSGANLVYLPATNYNGSDSFTFKANDGLADSSPATVSISISSVNDAPVAIAQSPVTAEDTAKAITLTGSDVDGNSLTFAVVSQPAHGTLSGTAPNLTYKPATNYNGADSFTFKANDGSLDSAPATVSISVTPVNDAPVAITQSVATDKNVAKDITLAGSDVDGDSLTFTVATQPTKGTLSGTAPNLTYTPNNNITGSDVFTFTANDGTVDSAAVPIYVNITAGPNTAPVANGQDITTAEDTAKAITLAATDADNNALTYVIVTPPAHGTLSGTAPDLTYTPTADYSGSDNFWFKANDGTTSSVPAVVSITITPVNDPPTLNTIANLTLGSSSGSQTVALSGISAGSMESQPLTISVGSSNPGLIPTPTVNYVSPAPTGSLNFTPVSGASGTSIVSVTVDDGQSQNSSVTRSFTVTVNASNITPTIVLTAPADKTSYAVPATIHLTASASATGHTITKVQFFGGTNMIGEDTSAPFEFDWNVANAGTYDLVARLIYDGSSTVDSKPVTVDVSDLPGPWESGKIGLTGNAGTQTNAGDVTVTGDNYTIEGAGALLGKSDSCRFVYQPLNADGEIKIHLTSADSMNKNSRAGVMMRESMTPGSKYAFVGISGDGYFRCQARNTTSGNAITSTIRGGNPGTWLRLVRSGKTVTSYRSPDGLNWSRLTSDNVAMATNIYVGIVVASGSTTSLAESTFSSPTVVP